MYCSSCGTDMPDQFKFCSQCGAPAKSGITRTASVYPLRRSREDKKIAGVCGGLGRYMAVDPTLIRIIVLCAAFWGVGVVFYVICWVAMPRDPLLLPPASAQGITTTPVRL